MTVAELDSLVERTDMTPIASSAMRVVRSAVLKGNCGDPKIGMGDWEIEVDNDAGRQVRLRFSFKRSTYGSGR